MSREGKTVTIRLSTKTKAALDIFAAKLTARLKENVTTDAAVWELLKQVDEESTRIAERNAPSEPPTEKPKGKK